MMTKIILYTIATYLILLILLYSIQRSLIYFPTGYAPKPEEVGVPEMSVVKVQTEDGLTLKAWYRPPNQPEMPTVVYFHGNAGNIGHRAFIVRPFLNEGFGVLLLTYRGYSGNPGRPTEQGVYSDARAAIQFLKQQGVPSQSTVLIGNSIGSAVAVQMATEYGIAAIVLQAPFTSLGDVGQWHYPFFPVKWFTKDKFDSLSKAKKVHVPVLIIHGKSDRIIPPVFSQRLFEEFSEPKQLHHIPNKGHNDLFEPELMIRFIEENFQPEG